VPGRTALVPLLAAALLGPLLPAPAPAEEDAAPPSPAALLDRAFENLYGDDFVQVMSLATRRRAGQPMVRRVQLVRKQSLRPGKALLRFLEPPEIRRTSVLILEAEGRTDDLFVYLPALGKVRRVSAGQRADAFFGTDLSYEDVEPKRAAEWNATLVERSEEGGTPCLRLDIRPKPEAESSYERMVSCIDPVRAVILRTDFWQGGQEVKQLRVRPEDVREVDGRPIPFAFRMSTPRLRTETLVTTETYEILGRLSEAIFTTGNLETGDAQGDRRAASGS
jgi:hypothetical protein